MIRRTLREWLYADNKSIGALIPRPPELNNNGCTNIMIFPAIGGQVVEFRRYDHRTDDTYSSRYVIHKDDDFAEKLSKIITLENLKN